jgi:hypothetical protein
MHLKHICIQIVLQQIDVEGPALCNMEKVEPRKCDKCSDEQTERSPHFELRVPISGEFWMLCESCLDGIVDEIEGESVPA